MRGRHGAPRLPPRESGGAGVPLALLPLGILSARFQGPRFQVCDSPPRASRCRLADTPLGAALHLHFGSRSRFCPSEQKYCRFQKFSLMVIPFSPSKIMLVQLNDFKLPPIPEVHNAQFFCSGFLFLGNLFLGIIYLE